MYNSNLDWIMHGKTKWWLVLSTNYLVTFVVWRRFYDLRNSPAFYTEMVLTLNRVGFSVDLKGGGGIIPSDFLSYFILFSHHKSTKQGFKWKLTSLSTCRVFEHHPKFNSFAIRWRRSSLIWPRKFPDFRYYNFWKFTIFYLNGQYVYQMKAENILSSNLA